MRVAVDVTPLLATRTGVAVFVAELLGGLAARPEVEPVGFALSWRGRDRLAAAVPDGVTVTSRPMPARPLRQAWLRADRPKVEWFIGSADVVHGTNFVVPPARAAAEVVTVHDLSPVRYRELVAPASLAYPRLIERAIRRGAWVHAPSAFVAGEAVELLGADPDRVRVVHHGVPEVAPAGGSGPRRPYPYVLAIGTIEPRKDLPTLVRAFDAVASTHRELRLVVAGPDGWDVDRFNTTVEAAKHRDRVERIGYVGDPERADLVRGAAAFAYPSLYEGFGFPPLEAMSVGVPVVATAAGSLPEVLGDAASMVPAGDADAIAAAIDRLLSDDGFRVDLVRRGHEQADRYSWGRAVDEMVALYRTASETR